MQERLYLIETHGSDDPYSDDYNVPSKVIEAIAGSEKEAADIFIDKYHVYPERVSYLHKTDIEFLPLINKENSVVKAYELLKANFKKIYFKHPNKIFVYIYDTSYEKATLDIAYAYLKIDKKIPEEIIKTLSQINLDESTDKMINDFVDYFEGEKRELQREKNSNWKYEKNLSDQEIYAKQEGFIQKEKLLDNISQELSSINRRINGEVITSRSELVDLFIVHKGCCEYEETESKALEILNDKNIDKDRILNLYKSLKNFEKEFEEDILSDIRAKEAFLLNEQTPTEIINEISKGVLSANYNYEYYGGYAGEDYTININLAEKTKEKLCNAGILEVNPNLEYYLKKEEICSIIEQIQAAWEYDDQDMPRYEKDLEILQLELKDLDAERIEFLESASSQAEIQKFLADAEAKGYKFDEDCNITQTPEDLKNQQSTSVGYK